MNIKEWAVEDRPREKLCNQGAKVLTNAELLAILLSTGTRDKSALDLAKDLLAASNNELDELAMKDLGAICEVYGIGRAKAVTVKAALELANRRKVKMKEKARMISAEDVFAEMRGAFRDLEVEEMWVLYLNKSSCLMSKRRISVGSVGAVTVDAKRIFKPAINMMASGVVMCHNHPSGRRRPSAKDVSLTEKIARAGRDLDVILYDHIIFAGEEYYSFKDEGLL